MNGSFLINQGVMYASVYLTNQSKIFFFGCIIKEWLYDSQFSQIKYRRRPSNIPVVECLSVKLQFN